MKIKINPDSFERVIIAQFFGIGDIIFCQTIAQYFIDLGKEVIWPVEKEFLPQLEAAYPNITWGDINEYKYIDWNVKVAHIRWGTDFYFPLRWSYEIARVPFWRCMMSKYMILGMDWRDWKKNAMWTRNKKKEMDLYNEFDIKPNERYAIVNPFFGSNPTRSVEILSTTKCEKVIMMNAFADYSLFDWALLLENATEIHTVSTSIIYVLEMLELKAEIITIHIRRPNETNHDNYKYILSSNKPYKLMP